MRRKHVKQKPADPLEASLQRELIRREAETLPQDFYAFVRAAWSEVEQYEYRDGMHIHAICEHMQAAAERRIKHLCINIAPRHGKSTLCDVMFPAWVLARSPKETLLFASYSQNLGNRDSVKCRSLIESEWYQERFPHVQIRDDSNLKTAFVTTAGGGRQTTSVGGTVTGLGGSFLIIDDPLNAKDGDSDTVRESANQWFTESWGNRVAGDPDQAVHIVIMQRLHSRDISHICEERGWDMLRLPTEYEGDERETSIGWKDPRTEHGQLLWPEQWSRKLMDVEKAKGEYYFASQYQQRPAPRGGGVFKRHWLKFWYDPTIMTAPEPELFQLSDGEYVPAEQVAWAPHPNSTIVASWDMTFKGTARSDFVVGQAWTKEKNLGYILLDQIRDRMDFPTTCNAVRRLNSKWRPLPTLVEGKANGSAVVSALKGEIDGLLEINPEGGKEARAAASAPLFEAGNVYLPHPKMPGFEWVKEYITELCLFPRAPNDDQVDATTQALVHLREHITHLVDPGVAYGGEYTSEYADAFEQEYYWS